jgi:uncharacterized iron-regulated protein
MKNNILLPVGIILILFIAMTTDKPAYKIFNGHGQESKYEQLLEAAKNADIVLFGELHDNPIGHWLELELAKDLYTAKKENLILGAEMLEADNQVILNEYLAEFIKESSFKESCRIWPNYTTDYRPLVEYAKTNRISFIATNIPRRYASIVASKGFGYLDSSITKEAKNWMAPLPIKYDPELKCYKDMLTMMDPAHTSPNLPKAQAIKDATMAYFILKNWTKGKTFLHFNGAYHSNNREGIVWYLLKEKPELKIVTISATEQESIISLDKDCYNIADYIICTPEDMTKTGH